MTHEDDTAWHVIKYGLAVVFGIFGTLTAVTAVATLTETDKPDIVYVPDGRYSVAPAADRAEGLVLVSGATCFAEGVEEAVTKVGIRWQWLDDEPPSFRPFYNESGGSTVYAPGRLPLDDDGCFTFSDFRQRMPPALVADLASAPKFSGRMEIVFTLEPVDTTDGARILGTTAFAFAGPFLIPPAQE